ncbi:hypothetical protein KL911_001214 [Ogataea haglerorum]|uniref:uncharacterized protein n=1 Tax=Ogataea haglerorum TaxID=1937702 RepID=UPI001C88F6D0|nr:uncharacterized protein KL911_001214 [Ogataea haglerorum]KAG7756412.1 hypothetical protein KL911_001214 [Ogataea haglerorum]
MSTALSYYRRRVSFNNLDVDIINDQSVPNEPPESVSKPKPILKNRDQVLTAGGDRYRKKSLVEMSDEEILQLDSQFATKRVNIDDFKFETDYPLVVDPFSQSKLARKTFHKLATDYPTRPTVRTSSLCFSFQHPDWSQKISNNRFYLVLISSKASSLGAIDYYLDSKARDGDNVIICCSINDEKYKDEYLPELMEIILDKFYKHDADLKVQINFEFCRSVNYLRDILNLYNPTAILVGSPHRKRRFGSIVGLKSIIPIVYVNEGYEVQRPQLIDRTNGIQFKQPFAENSNTPFITIDEADEPDMREPQSKKFSLESCAVESTTSSSSASVSSMNSFRKFKTNETSHSLLFEKLNDLPYIDDHENSSEGATRVKSMLGDDDAQSAVKVLSNSSGQSPYGSMSHAASGPVGGPVGGSNSNKLSLASIDPATGMAAPHALGKTKSNSIVDQYNRRMSVQKKEEPAAKVPVSVPARKAPPAQTKQDPPPDTLPKKGFLKKLIRF